MLFAYAIKALFSFFLFFFFFAAFSHDAAHFFLITPHIGTRVVDIYNYPEGTISYTEYFCFNKKKKKKTSTTRVPMTPQLYMGTHWNCFGDI